jgi:mannose-1-phosphate guanylyltransferase
MATITLTEVADARPYGLVEVGEGGRVVAFWEKPADPVPGMVNAGTYVLDPQAVAGVAPGRQVSVERDVFPALIAAARPVYGLVSPAYWRDLGTPEQYLQATFDVLEGRVAGLSAEAPFVHPSANVALRAQLGRWVVVGEGARVGHEAEVEDSVLLAGSVVEPGARIRDSILGPLATVGARAILAGAVLAEGARVPAGAVSEGARVSAGRVLGG